jgi:hypothetical protein
MATEKVHAWAALFGDWNIRGGSAIYQGNTVNKTEGSEEAQTLGIAVSNLRFREGVLRVRITLPTPFDQGRVILGLDQQRLNYYSIGIGGPRFAYYLDQTSLQPAFRNTALESWGPPSGLQRGSHDVRITLQSQALELTVDDIPIFGTTLPSPLAAEQVGAFAAGKSGIKFEGLQVDRTIPRVFVVMQYTTPFNELFDEVIRPVCSDLGLEAFRAADIQRPGLIVQDIVQALRSSAVVIAEISENNSNVFYELGYAHAIDKPTILLARRDADLPFDVSPYRVILYDDSISGKPIVERELNAHLRSILGLSPGG